MFGIIAAFLSTTGGIVSVLTSGYGLRGCCQSSSPWRDKAKQQHNA